MAEESVQSQDTEEPIVEVPTGDEVQPQPETQQDPVEAYRKIQAERDRFAAEKAQLESEQASLREDLKKRMDAEEREKYELAERVSASESRAQQLETELASRDSAVLKAKVLEKRPELKVFADDLDLSGMTEKEAIDYVEETATQLDKYVEAKNKAESEVQDQAPPAESSKSVAANVENISIDDFKNLSKEDRRKVMIARGILPAD